MEAEEPQHGVSTPIPALAELSVTPEALRRSRQTAALGPEAQEGWEPSSAWAEGRGLSETQRGASRDVKSCATKSVTSFPKEAPAGAETTQEDSVGEMGDTPELQELVPHSPTGGGARTPAPSQLGACLVQGEHLDMAPGSGELGGGVEMEFRLEPTSSTGETGHAEEKGAFPDASAQPRFGPSCEQCPEETHQPGDSVRHGEEPQLTAAREDTCHPKTSVPGTPREPRAEEPLPVAPAPARESGQWSSQPVSLPGSFPAGESPDQEIALDSQQEGSELGKGAVFTQGTELVSAGTSAAPPRTPGSAPCSPADVSPSTATPSSASPPVASSRRESSLAAHSSETSRASVWTNNTSHAEASGTPPAPLRGFLTTEATVEISTSSSQANPPSPLGHSTGAFQHLRSNSFPGSHRTEPTPDLLGLSLSFSHSELPQEASKPAIYGSVIPRRDRKSGRDGRIIPESPSSLSALGQDSQEFTSDPERSGSPCSTQPCGSRHTSASAPESIACGSSPPLVSVDARIHEPLPPPPPEKRRVHPSMVERDSHLHAGVPMLKRCGQPLPLAPGSGLHGPPKGPLPPVPDSLVARQHRPLPSTPDTPHPTQTSPSHRLRYNKPLPPTPDLSQTHHSVPSSSSPRTYRPLPPVPIVDPPTEPPPLPPKSRGRSRSTQGELMNAGGQGKPRPICPERTVATPHSVGRTSWPPAMGRSTDSSAPTSRSKSEGAPGMAFSNVATLLSPSSPTTPWSLELPGPTSEPGPSEESGAPGRGSLRRTAPQEGANGLRRLDVGQARQPAKLSHPHLEKASSWPHRRDPGRPPASSSGQVVDPGEGSSRHKGWNRQGLRRPSILPEGCSGKRPARSVVSSCRTKLSLSALHPSLSPGPLLFPLVTSLMHIPNVNTEGSP